MILDKMRLDDGREITLRYTETKDIDRVLKLTNAILKETEFMWRMSAIPKNEYTKIFSEKMARIKDGNEIEILAEHDGKLIGKCNVIRHTNETKSHTADYGIMILPEYRSLGLGKKLMNVSIKFAREKMNIEMIIMEVYSKNKIAQNLYKKMGFLKVGTIPNAIKQRSGYMDDIIMYKVLKK